MARPAIAASAIFLACIVAGIGAEKLPEIVDPEPILLSPPAFCDSEAPEPPGQSQIIVIAPSQIYTNGEYNVFVVSQNSTEPILVELLLSDSVEWTLEIPAPQPEGDMVTLSSVGLVEGTYSIRAQQGEDVVSASVLVSEKAAFLAVELDKKIYKPGDTVLIRAVLLNSDLFAVPGVPVEIEILTPSNLKLYKSELTSDSFGTIKNTFQLSAGTFTGTWKLKARSEPFGATAEVEFSVEEYVLPKFEVVVTPALNFLAQTDIPASIPVAVEATYVWGEPVMGTCLIRFKLPTPSDDTFEEIATYTGALDGSGSCFTSFDTSELTQSNLPLDKAILFEAVVTADATEESQEGAGELPIKETNVQVDLLADIAFQPGLQFPVTVVTTSADGGPLSGDLNITVNYRTKDSVLLFEEPLLFTTSLDASGKTTLILDVPFDNDTCCNPWTVSSSSFNPNPCPFCFQPGSFPLPTSSCKSCCLDKIEVTVDTGAEFAVPFERFPPTAALVLPPFWPLTSAADLEVKRMFSPTNSYLSVTYPGGGVGETVFVGETLSLAVQSTVPDVDVFYVALSRGKIVQGGKVPDLIEDNGVFIAPLSLDVTAIMSPELRIVCFYSTIPSGELVVDDLVLPVMITLPNLVSADFQSTEAAPGQNVSIDVQSGIGSRVYLLAIDKSVEILGGLNSMLTRSAIGSEVQAFDTADKPDSALNCHPTVGDVEIWSATEEFDKCVSSTFFPIDFILFSFTDGLGGGGEFGPGLIEDGSESSGSQSRAREVFPETWLWEEVDVTSSSALTLTRAVPDTITTWLMTGFSISPDAGLGILDVPSSLVVLKDFFIEPKLPFSLVRSESVRVVVGVFNYGSVPLSGTISLVETGFFTAIPFSQEFVVGPQSTSSVDFIITPLITGELSLFFAGETNSTNEVSDSIIRTLLVVPEGIPTEVVRTRVIQSDIEEPLNTAFPVNTTLPPNVVPNSARAQAQVSADFMTATIQGLESLLTIPYGCGEQNMITLVPNLAVLDYLTATNQLEPEIEEKAKNNIRDGIARQLQYQLNDKSFSAFGEQDGNGSTWLTAFVYRTFVHASEYVFVDDAVIAEILGYLINIQEVDGSFPEFGRVIHTDMLGGVDNKLTLTAYVLLSLIERMPELVPSGRIVDATSFIIQETPNISEDYYARILVAYILELIDTDGTLTGTFGALSLLSISSTSESGETFWAPNLETPASLSATAISVEMTAYAILALLASGDIAQSASPARWLIEARNSNGGFYSTQDTVVGLQALAEYSELSLTGADMVIVLEPETEGLDTVSFTLDSTNSNILQIQDLDVDEFYQVTVQGTGSAILSVVLKYNIPEVPLPPKYELTVTTSFVDGNDLITVEACARMIEESNEPSGMMLADIGIFSGYSPVISSLQALAANDTNLDMFELADKKVFLYLKEITTETYCASFDIMREFQVTNIQPVESVIFEYYHPELLGQAVTEFEGCESVFGDVNLDGVANILDVVVVVEFIVTGVTNAEVFSFECSNSNGDQALDVLDVTAILESIIQ